MSNKTFTNSKVIELDNKFYIKSDGDSGIVLVFHEPRKRENKKTGELEDYIFESKTYHPRIAQALKEYVNQSLNSSKTFKEIIEKEDKIFDLINNLDKTFKQF